MAKTTGIEWTDATVNFWIGCHKISQGCKNCYAERDMARYGRIFTDIRRTAPTTFNAALKWKEPKKIFTNSWSDFFIEEADGWRADAWDVIRRTPQHTWQILTKRPERILDHLPADWGNGWPNVWLGISTENQEQADKRIPHLLNVPAHVRFLSAEPLLGPLDLQKYWREEGGFTYSVWLDYISWVITGGESGSKDKIRTAELGWFGSIRDQCIAADVAFFHKQHGGNTKIDGIWGGRELDGETWDEYPE